LGVFFFCKILKNARRHARKTTRTGQKHRPKGRKNERHGQGKGWAKKQGTHGANLPRFSFAKFFVMFL
jgi:hypothetical protein